MDKGMDLTLDTGKIAMDMGVVQEVVLIKEVMISVEAEEAEVKETEVNLVDLVTLMPLYSLVTFHILKQIEIFKQCSVAKALTPQVSEFYKTTLEDLKVLPLLTLILLKKHKELVA